MSSPVSGAISDIYYTYCVGGRRASTIDPKLKGGRARCRDPSVRILVVEGGDSACSIDGAASDGKKVAFSAEMYASQFFEVARKARGEEEERTLSYISYM